MVDPAGDRRLVGKCDREVLQGRGGLDESREISCLNPKLGRGSCKLPNLIAEPVGHDLRRRGAPRVLIVAGCDLIVAGGVQSQGPSKWPHDAVLEAGACDLAMLIAGFQHHGGVQARGTG